MEIKRETAVIVSLTPQHYKSSIPLFTIENVDRGIEDNVIIESIRKFYDELYDRKHTITYCENGGLGYYSIQRLNFLQNVTCSFITSFKLKQ